MKARKVTFSFTCCFSILLLLLLYIDVRIQPPSTKTHLHLYYSFVSSTNSTNDYADTIGQSIKFISIFNQSSAEHVRSAFLKINNVTEHVQDKHVHDKHVASRAHIIAIVSYMRSGSTLTADIMQHFPGAMYVFEPFHSLVVRARSHLPIIYLNGTIKRYKTENITDDLLREELRKWFECRLGDLDIHSLTDNFHTQYSRSMRTLYQCWKPKPRTLKTLRECLPDAIKMCQSAKYRLFKFIRLPMRVLESVIDLYPGLQTIHLIRDPRGSLSSQIKIRNITWDRIGNLSEYFCHRVANDINSTMLLHRRYPDRVKILIYEKLAENPLVLAEKMHNFTKMPRYQYVMRYITKLTMSGRRSQRQFGSLRANSTKAAYGWRDTITFNHVQTIDENCESVYGSVGYQKLSSVEHVRNHNMLTLEAPESPVFL